MMNYYGWQRVAYPRPIGFGFGWIFEIIFWGLIILLIAAIIKHSSNNNDEIDDESPNKAMDILKERYAKGELTSREFEKMKKDIS